MKRLLKSIAFIVFIVNMASCGSPDKTAPNRENKAMKEIVVKTQYGSLPGNYTTQDEYYTDDDGSKKWHGHRKTFYPTGALKMDAIYEHGVEKDWKKYDEVGNIIASKN